MTHLHIEGRRWFDRRAGNTYFSATALLDGDLIASIEYEYGYGDHYLDRMLTEACLADDRLPMRHRHANGSAEAPHLWRDRTGIKLTYSGIDVARKKDLFWGAS